MSEENKGVSMIPTVTIEAKDLPSRGLTYPPGATVTYRTYTFGEVKQASLSSLQVVNAVQATMSGITTSDGFDKNHLTLMDAIYIGILRKVSTTRGSTYKVPYICEGCGKENDLKFTEDKLEFVDINAEVTSFPIEAEVAGKVLKFSPLTVKDYLELEKGRYNRIIKGGEPDRISLHALMIKNMDFKEAYELLYGLTDEDDMSVIEEVDRLLMHDIKPLEAVCPQVLKENDADTVGTTCNTVNYIALQGREQLIRPFRGGERSARSRIRIGASQPG